VQTLLQKGWIETTKSGPEKHGSLSADRRGFERKEVAHPNPTAKTVELELGRSRPSSIPARESAARRYCSDSGHWENILGHLKRTTPPNRIMLGSVVLDPDSAIPR
jgi:hypothetical protein